jgi:hypothetical protein
MLCRCIWSADAEDGLVSKESAIVQGRGEQKNAAHLLYRSSSFAISSPSNRFFERLLLLPDTGDSVHDVQFYYFRIYLNLIYFW